MPGTEPNGNRLLCFGPFEVNLRTHEVRKHGIKVKVHGASFEVLAALLERPGDLVTREELRRRLWPDGTFVDYDNSLNSAVNRLRDALADSADEPRYIETLPRLGYRWISAVEEAGPNGNEAAPHAVPAMPGAGATAATIPAQARPERRGGKLPASEPEVKWPAEAGRYGFSWRVAALVIVAGLLVGGALLAWRSVRAPAANESAPVNVAVLPLQVAEAEGSQLGMVLADDLIAQLSRVAGIRVWPRSAVHGLNGREADPVATGRELGVSVVLAGRAGRIGDGIQISASLIRVSDGKTVWAQEFSGSQQGIFELQDKVVTAVLAVLRPQLAKAQLPPPTPRPTRHVAAYQNYLQGLAFWNQRDSAGIFKSIDSFELAIAKDPEFALAYAALASALSFDQYRWGEAEPAALKALEINPRLGEAHAVLGFIRMFWEKRWPWARQEFKTAIDLSPNYATAHQWYALYYAVQGFLPEAKAEMEQALQLDPYSPAIRADMGQLFYFRGEFELARQQYEQALQLDPDLLSAHIGLYSLYSLSKLQSLATQKRAEISRRFNADMGGYPDCYGRAVDVALLGKGEEALDWLNRSYENAELSVVFLRADPVFYELREHPRFLDLLGRMSLAEKKQAR